VSTTDVEFNLQSLNTVWTALSDRVLLPACLITYLFNDSVAFLQVYHVTNYAS